jgi:hypothetical protein
MNMTYYFSPERKFNGSGEGISSFIYKLKCPLDRPVNCEKRLRKYSENFPTSEKLRF